MPKHDEEEEYSSDNSYCHSKRSELCNKCERREKRHSCKRCNKTESNKHERRCNHCYQSKCRQCKNESERYGRNVRDVRYVSEGRNVRDVSDVIEGRNVRENKCEQKKCVCGTSFVITIN